MRLVRWSVAVLSLASLSAAAEVKLPHVFGDHMVLQREQPIPVWGWAAPGEKVSVRVDDAAPVSATADDKGAWRVDLPAMSAGGPHKLTVAGSNTIVFDDVLVGEVWLCSGQSNMEFTMGGSHEAKTDIPAADFPQIRHFGVPKVTAASPQKDVNASWKVCSPATVGGFTAVGYFFAQEIHRTLNVPVGLLHSSWGGTLIEPWTTPEGFEVAPTLAAIRKRVELASPQSEAHRTKLREVIASTEGWLATARKALEEPIDLPAPPAFPAELATTRGAGDPCALYNAMIHPLVPFGLRGALWYQGESNHGDGKLYTDKMRALIEGWRGVWKQGPFPFYFVQIAPFQYGEEDPNVLPTFWEAQAGALAITNTGMAVIHDVGNIVDIHPRNKKDVGRRLAFQALAKTYGRADTVWSGPVFQSLETRGAELHVKFDHAHGGLKTRDGKAPSHFEIIGPDSDYVPADARIDGATVVLTATACPQPTAVRFGWHKTAEPNLCNGANLPAVQFRAGNVPKIDHLTKNVPEAKNYTLVYDLDLAKLGTDIAYDVDQAATAPAFDRVAYFVEVQKNGQPPRFVYVSMDAFTADAKKLGIPTFASGANFQQAVSNLTVLSNVPDLATGALPVGNIEFWPNNYGSANAAGVPGADAGVYDFGDQSVEPVDGYGCMQVHNFAAKQTLFAINQWKGGGSADIGLGNSTGQTRDWTFNGNAHTYTAKRLRVLVHPK